MKEPKQAVKSRKTRPVEYIPPPPEALEKYAYAVCKAMAEKAGQPTCDTELVRDFTTFIKRIVRMRTHELNRGGQHAT